MRSPRFLARLVSSTLLITLAACLPPLSLAHAAAGNTGPNTGALPPLADFFENPEFGAAELSPSGKYLAVRIGAKGKRDRLAVVTLADEKIQIVSTFGDADIGKFDWINDERLVFSSTDRSVGQGDVNYAPGLYAANRDGSKFTQLAARRPKSLVTENSSTRPRDLLPWSTAMLDQHGGQDSEFVYVTIAKYTDRGQLDVVPLHRLNTLNGRATPFERPGNTVDWLLDNKGEPRIATTIEKDTSTILYREPDTGKWRPLFSTPTYTGSTKAFTPLAFGPDGTLYVVTRRNKDTSALYTYDLVNNKIADKPVIELEGYDFRGHLIFSNNKLLGIRYLIDASSTHWFDADMRAMQDQVDAMLPNTNNLLTVPIRPESPWVLVTSYADRFPARTLLYNSATRQLKAVGASHPAIKPEQMAQQKFLHYAARDGLKIPAWLTLPQGPGKNLPMVVLVHGGPYVRGSSWGWEPDSQFLASRGYVVLEPEYRGSTGFGSHHFRAGWKQWGLKMQDDIADGARWAIAQGIADPKRICIAGASYGGYAALMGLINDKDLFRCGIDWAGVTDINLLYDGHWNFTSDLPDGWKQYGMPHLVGDQVKDAEQLKATSPLLRAAEIKQPLLLAYGGADMRVPLPHGTKFYQAVKQTNPDVEWVEYDEEGHGWALPKNRIDFWGRVEKFLDRHIGNAGGAQ